MSFSASLENSRIITFDRKSVKLTHFSWVRADTVDMDRGDMIVQLETIFSVKAKISPMCRDYYGVRGCQKRTAEILLLGYGESIYGHVLRRLLRHRDVPIVRLARLLSSPLDAVHQIRGMDRAWLAIVLRFMERIEHPSPQGDGKYANIVFCLPSVPTRCLD